MTLRLPKPPSFKGLRPAGEVKTVGFELTCVCGTSIRGQRQSQAQVAACPSCSAKRFVLPRSPLPEVVAALDVSPGPANRRIAVLLVLAAAAVIVVVAAAGIGAWYLSTSPEPSSQDRPLSDEEQYGQHLAAGRAALAEGSWHKAARELDAAIQIDKRAQGRFSKGEQEQLERLQRQAAIVADLLTESLAEIGRNSIGMPDDEWQQIFRERYAGRSFIIDDVLYRDSAGKYHYQFKLMLQNAEMRLDLGQVKLLLETRSLLNPPQRVLIGLRLAGIRKDAKGWVIELDPDGGVWLTDEDMLAGLSIPVDAELREVLKRQKSWVAIPR
jgi:DNA-directed RNA polymerase subunit RPC12/RpoP